MQGRRASVVGVEAMTDEARGVAAVVCDLCPNSQTSGISRYHFLRKSLQLLPRDRRYLTAAAAAAHQMSRARAVSFPAAELSTTKVKISFMWKKRHNE